MLRSAQKWLAIRSYAKGLGPKLRERYGKRNKYTTAQVKETASRYGFSDNYICFAFAMYCDADDFAAYHAKTGEACDYGAMRLEIGDRLFGGSSSFDAAAVIDSAASWSDGGGSSAGSSDGGGASTD